MTSPTDPSEDQISMRLAWRNADIPSKPVNQFVISMSLPTNTGQIDAIHLTLGQADPPLVYGSPQEMAQQLRELGTVHVETLGRYVLTRERLGELIAVLQQAATNFDEAQGRGGSSHDNASTESV